MIYSYPMMRSDATLHHMFSLRVNKTVCYDNTIYSDREFNMLMDRYGWKMPRNLHAFHFRGDFPYREDWYANAPKTNIPVYEITRDEEFTAVPEGLKLYCAHGPKSGVPIARRYFDFVWTAPDEDGYTTFAFVDGREYSFLSRYTPAPITLRTAREIVEYRHRHNSAPPGHKFSVSLLSVEDYIVGVLIASTPKARHQNDGRTLELNRNCADERYHNVCSSLMGHAIRIGKEMGYTRFLTYTQVTESGSSLKAVGFKENGIVKGKPVGWGNRPGRMEQEKYPDGDKIRWMIDAAA